jgi:hypothetical protein
MTPPIFPADLARASMFGHEKQRYEKKLDRQSAKEFQSFIRSA